MPAPALPASAAGAPQQPRRTFCPQRRGLWPPSSSSSASSDAGAVPRPLPRGDSKLLPLPVLAGPAGASSSSPLLEARLPPPPPNTPMPAVQCCKHSRGAQICRSRLGEWGIPRGRRAAAARAARHARVASCRWLRAHLPSVARVGPTSAAPACAPPVPPLAADWRAQPLTHRWELPLALAAGTGVRAGGTARLPLPMPAQQLPPLRRRLLPSLHHHLPEGAHAVYAASNGHAELQPLLRLGAVCCPPQSASGG